MNPNGDLNPNSTIPRNQEGDLSIRFGEEVTKDDLLRKIDSLKYLLSEYEYI